MNTVKFVKEEISRFKALGTNTRNQIEVPLQSLPFLHTYQYPNLFLKTSQFFGRRFFGTELHSPYDMHFLKADGM